MILRTIYGYNTMFELRGARYLVGIDVPAGARQQKDLGHKEFKHTVPRLLVYPVYSIYACITCRAALGKSVKDVYKIPTAAFAGVMIAPASTTRLFSSAVP
jgi:hypothetical protein